MKTLTLLLGLIAGLNIPGTCAAEVTEIHVAKEYGIGYLPFMVMEHDKLVEKRAKAAGLGDIKMDWKTFGGSGFTETAMISGALDFASSGVPWFLTLWSKTQGTIEVKGVGGMSAMPILLNTRNPNVKSIKDLTEKDRIALPAVKSSTQAIILQMAAEKAFGAGNQFKLDPLTVQLSHPEGMIALLSGISEMDAHFTSPPFQEQELKTKGIHSVLNSYDVLGGGGSFILVSTTSKFYRENPKTYAVFVAALQEAMDTINKNKRAAAEAYLAISNDKKTKVEDLVDMLSNPQYRYSLAPEGMMKFADFMYRIGSIKIKPASWKDMFFPNAQALPGS